MDADVIVVGAGPTGLLLAGDLAEAGLRVEVVERRTQESNVTRAFAVHARTMEQLHIRGIADELTKTGTTIESLRLFAGQGVDLTGLRSDFASLLITPQCHTEHVLTDRLAKYSTSVTRGSEVVGLTQDPAGVSVRTRDHAGVESTRRAAYVVGADGVNSGVRAALGLPFPGHSVVKSIMLADVRLTTPPGEVLAVNGVGDSFAFVAPFGDGWYRIFAWNRDNQVDDSAPLDLDEIRQVTRRSLGTDYGMHSPRWMSRFHSDERQVPAYRVGRVFLAGDAAHCHSPAGGQGMNTGLQDAANLGWKLAGMLHGWGSEQLLDSYHAERHPVGRQVLRSSGLLLRLALVKSRPSRFVRNRLAQLMLQVPAINLKLAETISAVGVRYPSPPGADRRVGTRVPNLQLREGGRLYDALHGGRFVLLGENAATLNNHKQVDSATPMHQNGTLFLVRPDSYIGWAGSAAEFKPWAQTYFRS